MNRIWSRAGANGLATLGALGVVVAGSALLDIASNGEIVLHDASGNMILTRIPASPR